MAAPALEVCGGEVAGADSATSPSALRRMTGDGITFLWNSLKPSSVIMHEELVQSCRIHINSGVFLMDSATSLSAPRRMTGWEFMPES